MKHPFFLLAASLLFGASACFAQETPAPAPQEEAAPQVVNETAPASQEVVPAPLDFEALVAKLPEVVVESKGEGGLVTREELVKMAEPQVKAALAQGAPLTEEMVMAYLARMAQGMGMQKIFLQNALEMGIAGDAQAVEKNLEEIKTQMKEQFDAQLAQLGMTEEELKERMIQEMVVGKYMQQLQENVQKEVPAPSEEAVRKFYDENQEAFQQPATYSASHILVQFPSQDPSQEEKDACLAKIREIQGKLAADASNFAELAKEYSDCPSKEKGGSLGEFPEGSMVPEFEAALATLKEGEVSQPVETVFGYHLILAGPSHPSVMAPFEDAKTQIQEYLQEMAMGEAMEKRIKEILDAVEFQVKLP